MNSKTSIDQNSAIDIYDVFNSQEYMLWILLAQTRNIITHARDNLINRQLIPPSQGAALYYISMDGGGVTIDDLARYLFRNHNSVSELLTRMQKKGWIKRVKEVTKEHRVRITLTAEGEKACRQATRPELIKEIMSSLTEEQRQQLQALLEIVREKAQKILKTTVPLPHLHNL